MKSISGPAAVALAVLILVAVVTRAAEQTREGELAGQSGGRVAIEFEILDRSVTGEQHARNRQDQFFAREDLSVARVKVQRTAGGRRLLSLCLPEMAVELHAFVAPAEAEPARLQRQLIQGALAGQQPDASDPAEGAGCSGGQVSVRLDSLLPDMNRKDPGENPLLLFLTSE